MPFSELRCLRCGRRYRPAKDLYVCRSCGGKLDVIYDYQLIAEEINREKLARRKSGVWKYFELLPLMNRKNIVSLGEGGTPLIPATSLAKELKVKHLYLKDETRNPTSSFKDRPMSVGVSKAVEFGARAVVCASSGNAAVALSAYAAKAGIKCHAFVPAGAPESKVAQLLMHGAHVVQPKERSNGDPTYKLMQESWKKFGWHPIPSGGAFNPYQPEGSKTISYEVCEQLGWQVPDWVIVPTGAGTLLSGNAKGYFEFQQMGLTREVPRLVAIQAEGCAPIVKAFKEGTPPYEIQPWPNPKTVAGGLVDPYPWDADTAIPAIKRSNGTAASVSDAEILEAVKRLARSEGIFAEPSGAAGLAGLKRLLDEGVISGSDIVVVEVTGGGLKDVATAMKMVEKPVMIDSRLEQLRELLVEMGKSGTRILA
ncbi:MAG: threonine synthase [Candidatus Hadarchaeum sp.]|uniref:threonine synthase n=1 Tax=Candidatus Hadarchaeum sp. TaxID=2883567 RepID=UPI00317B34EE